MRTITFLSLVILSKLAFTLTVVNKTNKNFVLNTSEKESITIAQDATIDISNEIANNLEIFLAVEVAGIYKIKDHENNILRIKNDINNNNDNEALFNISINNSSKRFHSNLSEYEEITISYYDQDKEKEDDALLMILTKRADIAFTDAANAQFNCKCSIF